MLVCQHTNTKDIAGQSARAWRGWDFEWEIQLGFWGTQQKRDRRQLYNRGLAGDVRGGIKKKNWFFSEKLRKGGRGVSPNPKFPYQKKLRFFWNFFYKGGGVLPIPKGCYHKKMGILGYFCQKGGSYRFYQKKTQNISDFFAKWGGVWPIPKFPYQKKLGHSELLRGGGGLRISEFFWKKNSFFFMPPLMA